MDIKTLKIIIYHNLEPMKTYKEQTNLYKIKLIDSSNQPYLPEPTHTDKYGINYYNEYTIEPPYLIVETFDIVENLKHSFSPQSIVEF